MQRKQTLCYQVPFNLHNNIFFSGEESVSAEMKSIFPSMQPTSSRNTDEQQSHEALMARADKLFTQLRGNPSSVASKNTRRR